MFPPAGVLTQQNLGGNTPPVLESYQASSSGQFSAGSLNLAAPSGITAGDLLIILIQFNYSTTTTLLFNEKAGWIKKGEWGVSGCLSAIYYRVATGGEGTVNISLTQSNGTLLGWYLRVSGVDTAQPIEALDWNIISATATQPAPSVPTSLANTLGLYYDAQQVGTLGLPMSVAGTGWSEVAEASNGLASTTYNSSSIGQRDNVAAGDTPIATVTSNGAYDATTAQIAVRPASPDAWTGPIIEDYTATNSAGALVGSLIYTAPSGITANEILVLIVITNHATSGSTINTPAGWTKRLEYGDNLNDQHIAVFYKVATGSEGNTEVTGTASARWMGWYLRVSGGNTTTPISASSGGRIWNGTPYSYYEQTSTITTPDNNSLGIVGISGSTGSSYKYTIAGGNWNLTAEDNSTSYVCGAFGTARLKNAGTTKSTKYTNFKTIQGSAYFQLAIKPA